MSAIDVPGRGALMGRVVFGDPSPVRGQAAESVPAQFEDGGDRGPGQECEKSDEEYHGRKATVVIVLPRVAELTFIRGKLPIQECR